MMYPVQANVHTRTLVHRHKHTRTLSHSLPLSLSLSRFLFRPAFVVDELECQSTD